MLDKRIVRAIAESERMMDNGQTPFVWAANLYGVYERLAVAPVIMEDLGLEQGQTINWVIQDAIAELSAKLLADQLSDIVQQVLDQQLTDDFDFRKEM